MTVVSSPSRVTGGPPSVRLDQAFEDARRQARVLLAGCLHAGWPPTMVNRAAAWRALAANVDLIEIALPTTDPYFDGETMRTANRQALAAGYRHEDTLALISWLSARVPVLVMAYWRTIAEHEAGRMARELAAAGAAGTVLPDLPVCRTARWVWTASAAGLATILLTSPDGSPRHPAAAGTGAVYLPAAAGATGGSSGPDPGLPARVRTARARTGLPVITGIGISSPADVYAAARAGAECVLVGSAFARAAATADPGIAVSRLASSYRKALTSGESVTRRRHENTA